MIKSKFGKVAKIANFGQFANLRPQQGKIVKNGRLSVRSLDEKRDNNSHSAFILSSFAVTLQLF